MICIVAANQLSKLVMNIQILKKLDRGIKQRECLSPTLFNCFINDLHECFYFTCDPLVLE